MYVVMRSNIISDYLKGIKPGEIARKYNCSPKTVSRWISYYKKKKLELNEIGKQFRVRRERIERAERSLRGERGVRPVLTEEEKQKNLEKQIISDLNQIDLTKKKIKKRISLIPHKIKLYLYKQFADKRTGGKEGRSIRKVIAKANKKFKLKDPKKFKGIPKEERRLSYGTVQRFLVMKFGRARKLIKKPLLKPSHISQRKVFAEYIIKNEIDYKKIFFTDEKRFIMNFVPNKQTNQIRLSKLTQRKLKQNNQEVEKLLTVPVEKHPKGVMVAGGVSYYGVGKLNFIVGAMDSCAYRQTLINYKKDIEFYKSMGVDLIFQQDNCPSHVSAEIKQILKDMYKLDFWPPNSPDLSPIESVWAEVQAKLEGYNFKNMDDFRKKIVYEWNRVPSDYCQRICDKFIDDIKQIYQFGRIKEKQHVSKGLIFKKNGLYKDEIENIVYNKYSLKNVIKFNIKELIKSNDKLKSIIYKIKSSKFKNRIKDEINIESFDDIYKEVVKENEDVYIKNKKEIHKLKRISLDDYFNNLTHKQKIKICNLAARYNDEFKQEGINSINNINNKFKVTTKDNSSDSSSIDENDDEKEEEEEEEEKQKENKENKENKEKKENIIKEGEKKVEKFIINNNNNKINTNNKKNINKKKDTNNKKENNNKKDANNKKDTNNKKDINKKINSNKKTNKKKIKKNINDNIINLDENEESEVIHIID